MKNVPIPDDVHKRLKMEAAIRGVTMISLIVDALDDHLDSGEQKKDSREG